MIIITGDSKVSDEEEEEIGDMINIVFGGIIIVTGTIGNLLSLIILRTGDLKNLSTCFYMSMLAVADLGKCSIGTLFFLSIQDLEHFLSSIQITKIWSFSRKYQINILSLNCHYWHQTSFEIEFNF